MIPPPCSVGTALASVATKVHASCSGRRLEVTAADPIGYADICVWRLGPDAAESDFVITVSDLDLDKVTGGDLCKIQDSWETGYLKGMCSQKAIYHIEPEYRPSGVVEWLGWVFGKGRWGV
jgi:hypothetical protein